MCKHKLRYAMALKAVKYTFQHKDLALKQAYLCKDG